ncbi:hypothetical protein LCGC14_0163340 [marine sediment metagenome]|uniref:Uncharacterized protein n=1 Tax=marine sediment metagenome TaxID=412755 RepID=A0A0F9UUD0_9ZZZZ
MGMSIEWTRVKVEDLDILARPVKSLDQMLEKRIYRPSDAEWPLLSIGTYPRPCLTRGEPNGFVLGVSMLEDADGWWEDTSIPRSLLSEAIEMLMNLEKA